jgi:isorenieratene synthase
LSELGGFLSLGQKVTSLERSGDGWRVHWESAENPGQAGEISARHIILATDAPNTEKILHSGPDTALAAANLVFPRGMATAVVRLWFDRAPAHTSEGGIFSGDFILDNFFWLDRLQEPYLRWRKATGGSAIEAHIYGPPDLLSEPDAALLARAISDVQAAFPELRGHRIYQLLQRNDATHTLFGLGPAEKHLGTVTPWPGIFCCGDWVRHPAPALFLERAVVTGMAAVNAVLKERGKDRWPILDHPEPESFVAGIEKLMKKGRRIKKARKYTINPV